MTYRSNHSVRRQTIWNRLLAIVEEQAQVLKRTAFSPLVRSCGDLSVGVFDPQGRMLAQAVTGTPGHVNTMADSVRHFLAAYPLETMRPNDAFITNDPWMGTGHLNDFVVVTPCFVDGRCVALFSCTSHMMDVGGLGASTEAPDVFAEGLYIPIVRLIDQGAVNETLVALIRANSRLPIDTVGDTYSLAACNDVGVERLQAAFQEFGLTSLDDVSAYVIEKSRAAMLRKIAALPRGSWRNEMVVDGYDRPLTLKALLTVSDAGINVDFSGSAEAVPQGINVPFSYAAAYASYAVACALSEGIPNNHGSLSPVTITAPAGSIVNAVKPAPVGARHVIGQSLPDLVFGCLAQVVPQAVLAEGSSCLWNIAVRGRQASGEPYAVAVTTSGGMGARFAKDGLSATAFPSGIQCMSIEVAETQAPVIFWRKELRPDSGGAGRTRGGLGQLIEVEHREGASFRLNAAFERVKHPARGSFGGAAGAPGYAGLASGEVLPGKGILEIPAGQRLVIRTPGGGGFGDVRERAPALVRHDLDEGRITPDGASRDYFAAGQTNA